MSQSWLQRKRKGELLELAQRANLPDADRYLKDDLVDALQDHLATYEPQLVKIPAFIDYYRLAGSPIKRERSSPEAVEVAVPRRRRQTLKSAEIMQAPAPAPTPAPVRIEQPTPERSLYTRTPRTISRVGSRVSQLSQQISPSQVDLPASPAQLAEVADQSFQAAKTKATEIWEKTRIEETIEILRENASSVVFIQLLVLNIEAAGLAWNTLTTTYAFSSPTVGSLASRPIYLPDLWILLSSDFWAPATLWSLTNWALPLLVSYFFNLTLRSNTRHKSTTKQYTIDPLTFNIARALLAYNAYSFPIADVALAGEPGIFVGRKPGWGPFAEYTVQTVRQNVPGKYYGLQIGSVVGILYSLYDAALKK